MTQVANLNAGMCMPGQNNSVSKKEKPTDLTAEFAGIMNQNTQSFHTSTSTAEWISGRTAVGDTKNAVPERYGQLGSSGSRKITQAQANAVDKTDMPKKVQKLAGDVKDTIRETMDVSEEELEQAMEVLGLEMADLLQPQNLIQLVQQLTGSTDASALLTDAGFQQAMQEVNGLIVDFQQENGLDEAQFSDLLAQLSTQIDEMEEQVKQLFGIGHDEVEPRHAAVIPDAVAETGIVQETSADGVSADRHTAVNHTAETETGETADQMVEQLQAVDGEKHAEEFSQTAGQNEHSALQNGKNRQHSMTQADHDGIAAGQHASIFQENQLTGSDQPNSVGPQMPQVQGYVELEHLMDQLEGLARTFASSEGTTVEMQLNPESLGRLVLTVTEKHGNVTAQIAASNEQVKEALQTQMVELRSTLQAQGIKVEAVEVTVATHEFEQNLDGNTSAGSQMQEQAEKGNTGSQGRRRNLDPDSLDALSGLMSEEEELVARIMRDHGGTVDYTA